MTLVNYIKHKEGHFILIKGKIMEQGDEHLTTCLKQHIELYRKA